MYQLFEFADGGVLELVLGSKESEWGTGIDDLPPISQVLYHNILGKP